MHTVFRRGRSGRATHGDLCGGPEDAIRPNRPKRRDRWGSCESVRWSGTCLTRVPEMSSLRGVILVQRSTNAQLCCWTENHNRLTVDRRLMGTVRHSTPRILRSRRRRFEQSIVGHSVPTSRLMSDSVRCSQKSWALARQSVLAGVVFHGADTMMEWASYKRLTVIWEIESSQPQFFQIHAAQRACRPMIVGGFRERTSFPRIGSDRTSVA